MFEKVFERAKPYTLAERKACQSYTLNYCDKACKNLKGVVDNLNKYQENFKCFCMTVGTSRQDQCYYEELKKAIANPNPSIIVHLKTMKSRDRAKVLLAIALLVKLRMISIKPNTPFIPLCDISTWCGNETEVTIASRLTNYSQQRIDEIYERFKDYTDMPPPQNGIHSSLPKLLRLMRIEVIMKTGKPVKLRVNHFLDTLAMHMMVESKECPSLGIPDSFKDMSRPLDVDEWATSACAQFMDAELPILGKKRIDCLGDNPNPPCRFEHPAVIPIICNKLDTSDESTDENLLANGTAATRQNAQEEGADVGAAMRAAELDEGENVDDNYEFINFVPVDTPVAGDGWRAGPNQGQNPVHRPTSAHPISSTPNAERAGATNAGSANSQHNALEAPTARKHDAAAARVEPDRIFATKESPRSSSEGSDIEIVSVAQVERPDAETAEPKRRRANKCQRAGSQTNARGVGPHVRRTSSQDPQQCVRCMAGRISDSEGSDVAGDSSDLFYEICREYMHRKRNKARKARRGPRMR